jgi:hypothetical protein
MSVAVSMACLALNGHLDDLDNLNPTRALILQAYYGLRRAYAPTQIGVPQITAWIKQYEPHESLPSESLILLTLRHAKIPHRPRGRPQRNDPTSAPAPPFFLPGRPLLHDRARP